MIVKVKYSMHHLTTTFQHRDRLYPGHVHVRVHVPEERAHRHQGRAYDQKPAAGN